MLLKSAALKSLNCTLILKTEYHFPAFYPASSLLTIHKCYWGKGLQLLVGTLGENITGSPIIEFHKAEISWSGGGGGGYNSPPLQEITT